MTGVLRPSKQRAGMKRPRNEPYRFQVFGKSHRISNDDLRKGPENKRKDIWIVSKYPVEIVIMVYNYGFFSEKQQSRHYTCAEYWGWGPSGKNGPQFTPPGFPHGHLEPHNYRFGSNFKRFIIEILDIGYVKYCAMDYFRSTNEDGRCPGLITSDAFTPGMYKIRFETGQYWESLGQSSFYPYVEVVFTISNADQSFHVPLLVSRFSYSTYRGS
ncbi:5-hydroxyisourate hydrolase-like protein [Labeo rohita]|uniref:hydroxyisourate hydrolase n=1 Tax=Labeo rohita TaxID=84645 RepID=A0A498LQC7_LABRO|nr:5-hydroxyisourate hydrolase-like protein [Labeo rohita]